MNVDRLEQLAMHCEDLEGTAALLREALGLTFGAPRFAGVAGDRLQVLASPTGIVLVDANASRPEGLRAVGFRVRGLQEMEARFAAHGVESALEIDGPGYRERQYDIANVRFSLAEYDAPNRLSGAEQAGILQPER